MKKKVIIIGGGIGGLSAAHELLERGFDVEIFEAKDIPGGKARSVNVTGTGKEGRRDLPGEHGFRFFPRFYKHITDTMRRIPFGENPNGVFDNLVDGTDTLISVFKGKDLTTINQFPTRYGQFKSLVNFIFGDELGITVEEKDFFAFAMWKFMTSCEERRFEEYEKIGWWEYIEADRFSKAYQKTIGELPRVLVAAKPRQVSTKTGASIFLQLWLNALMPGGSADRVLNGPTNDVFIEPWIKHLERLGGNYHLKHKLKKIVVEDGSISHVEILADRKVTKVKGDHYIFALPVEKMAEYIDDDMLKLDPGLKNLHTLAGHVSWMNGIQYYLNIELPIIHGHVIYNGTPWALTSISQKQFWQDYDLANFGDGKVKEILSIDISEWDRKGVLFGRKAKECTKEEIAQEVWAQLKLCLNDEGEFLKDEYLLSWYLDSDIEQDKSDLEHFRNKNEEPLLVNRKNSWHLRPEAHTKIPNMYLASDYVKTNTDLASMEGANEAARRAVNAIIDRSEAKVDYCKIWELEEPPMLEIYKIKDKMRLRKGLPWKGITPVSIGAIDMMWKNITRFWKIR